MPEPAAHPVPDDGVADGLAHDETRPRRGVLGHAAGTGRIVAVRIQVNHQPPTTCAATALDRRGELGPAGEPGVGRQHGASRWVAGGIRPRGCRAPCAGARRRWRDRRGCACAAGNRASWPGGGCSAGKYACSRRLPVGGSQASATPSFSAILDGPARCGPSRTCGLAYCAVLGAPVPRLAAPHEPDRRTDAHVHPTGARSSRVRSGFSEGQTAPGTRPTACTTRVASVAAHPGGVTDPPPRPTSPITDRPAARRAGTPAYLYAQVWTKLGILSVTRLRGMVTLRRRVGRTDGGRRRPRRRGNHG